MCEKKCDCGCTRLDGFQNKFRHILNREKSYPEYRIIADDPKDQHIADQFEKIMAYEHKSDQSIADRFSTIRVLVDIKEQ